jgi:Uma2 family endonuclease
MSTIVVDSQSVHIPPWVSDQRSFRRWARSDEFPESGRICFLAGEVWVDMSKEQFAHNQIKGEFNRVIAGLARDECPGRYFPDGMLLSHVAADLTVQPDGMFASVDALRGRRIRLIEGAEEGFVELEGTPDVVLEVISAGSVQKDTVLLRDLYWQAEIPEYWLVDARGQRLEFNILRHSERGYVAVRKNAGWIKSGVFRKSFQLVRRNDALGYPEYTLKVR